MSLIAAVPQNPDDARNRWLAAFDRYAVMHSDEAETVAVFRAFALTHADAAERTLAIGHLTGSAWLVDRGGTHVLLTHHRKLDHWLGPFVLCVDRNIDRSFVIGVLAALDRPVRHMRR